MANIEIERKWLIDGFPNMPHGSESFQEQAYLAFEPCTVRIRKSVCEGKNLCEDKTDYTLTIKGGGTLARTEVETPLSAGQYAALKAIAAAPAATKKYRRYALPGGLVLECSLVDEGEPCAFYYAEVEFESEEAANAFAPPPFLGREVTFEPGQSMAAYCLAKKKAAEEAKGV